MVAPIRTALVAAVACTAFAVGTPSTRAQDAPSRTPVTPGQPTQPANLPPQTSAWHAKVGGTFTLDKLNARRSFRFDVGGAWDALPTIHADPEFGVYLTTDGLLSIESIAHDHPGDAEHPNGGTEEYAVPSVSVDALAIIGWGDLKRHAYRVYGVGFPLNLHYSQEFGRLHPEQSVTTLTGGGGIGPAYVSAADPRSKRDAAGKVWEPDIQANRFIVIPIGLWGGAATAAPALRLDATVPVALPFAYARYITYDYSFDIRAVVRGSPVIAERAFDYADANLVVKYSPLLLKKTHWIRPFVEVYASVATVKVPVAAFERTHADARALFGVEFLGLLSATEPPQRFDASTIQGGTL